MMNGFIRLTYIKDDQPVLEPTGEAVLEAPNGRRYFLFRCGKSAKCALPGRASLITDSGNKRKPIRLQHFAIGEVFLGIAESGSYFISDDDWQILEKVRKFRVAK